MSTLTKEESAERHARFLDLVFDEGLSYNEAAEQVGYAPRYGSTLARLLKDEIVDRIRTELAVKGPAAVRQVDQLLTDGTAPGSAIQLQMVRDLFDRIGVIKQEKVTVETNAPSVIILPAKASE